MKIENSSRALPEICNLSTMASALALALCLLPAPALAGDDEEEDRDDVERASGFCSATAQQAFRACGFEVKDDYAKAVGICINVSDDAEREQCLAEAKASRSEGVERCSEQKTARLEVCKLVGEGRYDPDFDPGLFESDFANLASPNRYFPLKIGNKWEYQGGAESVTVEVLNPIRTKLIEGVTCIVVNDRVTQGGRLVEDTDDWFAQAKNGDVYYCGEEVKDFETFEGDRPPLPELVSIDGSFKAGRDGDKPGIIFLANPKKGDVYRQEFSLGNAEDVAQVLSTTYGFGADAKLDEFVPQQLAQLFCQSNCVVTREFSPLEPGPFARKYYAPGIGFFLEVGFKSGQPVQTVQLVSCNFDSRCGALPKP